VADRIAQVMTTQAEAINANAVSRLAGRGEFAGDRRQLESSLARLTDALVEATRTDRPELLTEVALTLGRDDSDPFRGYGRVQLLLDVLCSESVEALRRAVTGPEGKEASARLRGMMGPAMLGLAALGRQTTQANSPESGSAPTC